MQFQTALLQAHEHLNYIDSTLKAIAKNVGTSSLADRALSRSQAIQGIEQRRTKLIQSLSRPSCVPSTPPISLDPWRNVYSLFIQLMSEIHEMRVMELPTYLARTPDDLYITRLVSEQHRELKLINMDPGYWDPYLMPVAPPYPIMPVISLHQGNWFRTWATDVPWCPLYCVPASVASDPGELALMYHEMGHLLYNMKPFRTRVSQVARDIITVKSADLSHDPNPFDKTLALERWKAQDSSEEAICDAVGAILGGPAFVATFVVALQSKLPPQADPAARRHEPPPIYTASYRYYPPIDARARLCLHIGKSLWASDPLLTAAEAQWQLVQDGYQESPPLVYSWLYDDAYMNTVKDRVWDAISVIVGLDCFGTGVTAVRDQLYEGACARLSVSLPGVPAVPYSQWISSADSIFRTI